jgi:hypothetical protein
MQQLEQVTLSQNDRFPTQQSWKTSHRISSKAGTHVKQQRHESRSRRAQKMGKSRRARNSAKKLRNPGSSRTAAAAAQEPNECRLLASVNRCPTNSKS